MLQEISKCSSFSTSDEVWPGVTQLRDYNPMFPRWHSKDLAALLSRLDGSKGADKARRRCCGFPCEKVKDTRNSVPGLGQSFKKFFKK